MIIVIRIAGMVKVRKDVEETLFRMRLRRKYSAILLEDTETNKKLLRNVRDYVAYGKINEKMLEKLIDSRAERLESKGKKIESKKIIENLKKKNLKNLEIKPFFRLHPPRGGIESKRHFGVKKGVLGDNKEKINNLLEKML